MSLLSFLSSLFVSRFSLRFYLLVSQNVRLRNVEGHRGKKSYARNIREIEQERCKRAADTTAKNAISCRECQAKSKSSGCSKSSDKACEPFSQNGESSSVASIVEKHVAMSRYELSVQVGEYHILLNHSQL